MSGREDERDDTGFGGAYDDWFDEPEPPSERRRRGQRRAAAEADEDRWVVPDEQPRRPARRGPREPLVIAGREVTQLQAFLVGGSALVILLAILAAAGVFSGGSKPVAQPTTVSTPKPPPTTTQTTQTTTTSSTASVTPPSTPLKPGDSGSQVTLLQKALEALGFATGKPDGTYGPSTTNAVKQFQNSKELTADGIAGSATIAALRQALAGESGGGGTTSAQAPTTTLKPGDSGTQVTLLQQALAALGYSPGTADGTYGSGTKQAVSAFQQAQGLAADGVVGPQTLAALQQALATTG
ncbi:MAG TPA: peptidoglycan-binding protein [Gaiellaceae bacterium]|nr:peptidoglycan-binding protein [Gaiellaceae bacterium]